jgi:antitoxin ParD1/3/4
MVVSYVTHYRITLHGTLHPTRGTLTMYAEKLSVSLPAALAEFVEQYRTTHACKSRSQVIERALLLLRQRELEQAYGEAAKENDPDWEITTADGLGDAPW